MLSETEKKDSEYNELNSDLLVQHLQFKPNLIHDMIEHIV